MVGLIWEEVSCGEEWLELMIEMVDKIEGAALKECGKVCESDSC